MSDNKDKKAATEPLPGHEDISTGKWQPDPQQVQPQAQQQPSHHQHVPAPGPNTIASDIEMFDNRLPSTTLMPEIGSISPVSEPHMEPPRIPNIPWQDGADGKTHQRGSPSQVHRLPPSLAYRAQSPGTIELNGKVIQVPTGPRNRAVPPAPRKPTLEPLFPISTRAPITESKQVTGGRPAPLKIPTGPRSSAVSPVLLPRRSRRIESPPMETHRYNAEGRMYVTEEFKRRMEEIRHKIPPSPENSGPLHNLWSPGGRPTSPATRHRLLGLPLPNYARALTPEGKQVTDRQAGRGDDIFTPLPDPSLCDDDDPYPSPGLRSEVLLSSPSPGLELRDDLFPPLAESKDDSTSLRYSEGTKFAASLESFRAFLRGREPFRFGQGLLGVPLLSPTPLSTSTTLPSLPNSKETKIDGADQSLRACILKSERLQFEQELLGVPLSSSTPLSTSTTLPSLPNSKETKIDDADQSFRAFLRGRERFHFGQKLLEVPLSSSTPLSTSPTLPSLPNSEETKIDGADEGGRVVHFGHELIGSPLSSSTSLSTSPTLPSLPNSEETKIDGADEDGRVVHFGHELIGSPLSSPTPPSTSPTLPSLPNSEELKQERVEKSAPFVVRRKVSSPPTYNVTDPMTENTKIPFASFPYRRKVRLHGIRSLKFKNRTASNLPSLPNNEELKQNRDKKSVPFVGRRKFSSASMEDEANSVDDNTKMPSADLRLFKEDKPLGIRPLTSEDFAAPTLPSLPNSEELKQSRDEKSVPFVGRRKFPSASMEDEANSMDDNTKMPSDFRLLKEDKPLGIRPLTSEDFAAPTLPSLPNSEELKQSRDEKSAPFEVQSRDEKSAPFVVQSRDEKSAPFVVQSRDEKSAPFVVQSRDEKSAPFEVQSRDEKSAPFEVQSRDKKSAPFVVQSRDEKSAPFVVQSRDEKSAPFEVQSRDKKSAPFVVQSRDEKSAPFVIQSRDEKSAPFVVQSRDEKSAPFVVQSRDEKSVPFVVRHKVSSPPIEDVADSMDDNTKMPSAALPLVKEDKPLSGRSSTFHYLLARSVQIQEKAKALKDSQDKARSLGQRILTSEDFVAQSRQIQELTQQLKDSQVKVREIQVERDAMETKFKAQKALAAKAAARLEASEKASEKAAEQDGKIAHYTWCQKLGWIAGLIFAFFFLSSFFITFHAPCPTRPIPTRWCGPPDKNEPAGFCSVPPELITTSISIRCTTELAVVEEPWCPWNPKNIHTFTDNDEFGYAADLSDPPKTENPLGKLARSVYQMAENFVARPATKKAIVVAGIAAAVVGPAEAATFVWNGGRALVGQMGQRFSL